MADWITRHKASLQYIIWTLVGLTFIGVGLFNGREPAMIALGAGAIGLPNFAAVSGNGHGS